MINLINKARECTAAADSTEKKEQQDNGRQKKPKPRKKRTRTATSKFFYRKEICKQLNIGTYHFDKLREQGLHGYKFGKTTKYNPEEVVSFIREHLKEGE